MSANSHDSDDEEELPRQTMQSERLRYAWYADYERSDEYDKHPQWADDTRCVEETIEDNDGYEDNRFRFYDKFDPERIWITSAKTYSLFTMR